jgi:hypothetical protein
MRAIADLGYRVTLGDVAVQAGLEVNDARKGLLALAADTGAHLQVAESGDVVYQFSQNFRTILLKRSLQLRLQTWGRQIWRGIFYLIRISFGVALLVSIALILMTIALILIAYSSRQGGDERDERRSSGGMIWIPQFWLGGDWWWIFVPDFESRRDQHQRSRREDASRMNFLEAVYSFLFGDGNPNADLEERRWQAIATVIRNHQGAVVAEQITPYLEDLGTGYSQEFEDYMVPVLLRFDGRPEVSPQGALIYHFPELQTTATQQSQKSVPAYLQEQFWRFSQASSGQMLGVIGLGGLNFIGALLLGSLFEDRQIIAELGGLVAFVHSIYWLLLSYGTAFVVIPGIRYFWLQRRNQAITLRNQERYQRTITLTDANPTLQEKLAYAHQFAAETVLHREQMIYTTEKSLIEQESDRSDRLDADWQKRLDQSAQ